MPNDKQVERLRNSLVAKGFTFKGETSADAFNALRSDSTRMAKLYDVATKKGFKLGSAENFQKNFGTWQNAESTEDSAKSSVVTNQQANDNAEDSYKSWAVSRNPNDNDSNMPTVGETAMKVNNKVEPSEEESMIASFTEKQKDAKDAYNIGMTPTEYQSQQADQQVQSKQMNNAYQNMEGKDEWEARGNAKMDELKKEAEFEKGIRAKANELIGSLDVLGQFKEETQKNEEEYAKNEMVDNTFMMSGSHPISGKAHANTFIQKAIGQNPEEAANTIVEKSMPKIKEMVLGMMFPNGIPETEEVADSKANITKEQMDASEKLVDQYVNIVSEEFYNAMYNQFKKEVGPSGQLDYIFKDIVLNNTTSQIAFAIMNLIREKPDLGLQLLNESMNGFDAKWYTKAASSVGKIAVDSGMGYFKIGSPIASRVGNWATNKVIRAYSTDALGSISKVATNYVATDLATKIKANVVGGALKSGISFVPYSMLGEAARMGNDNSHDYTLKEVVLNELESGVTGFLDGAVIGASGGYFGTSTEGATKLGKFLGDVTGLGVEGSYFTGKQLVELANAKGIDLSDLTWSDVYNTAAENFGMVLGLRATHPGEIVERYNGKTTSSIGMRLDTKDLKEINGILGTEYKTVEDFVKDMDAANSSDIAKALYENGNVEDNMFFKIMKDSDASLALKQKVNFLQTSKYLALGYGVNKDGKLFVADNALDAAFSYGIEEDANTGKFYLLLKNEHGSILEREEFDSRAEAQNVATEVNKRIQDNQIRFAISVASRLDSEAAKKEANELIKKILEKKPEERNAGEVSALNGYLKRLDGLVMRLTNDARVVEIYDIADDEIGQVVIGQTKSGKQVTVKGMDSGSNMVMVTDADGNSEMVSKSDVTEVERIPAEEAAKENVEYYDPNEGAKEGNKVWVKNADGIFEEKVVSSIDENGNVKIGDSVYSQEDIAKMSIEKQNADAAAEQEEINKKNEQQLVDAQAQQKEEELNAPYWILDKKSGKYVPANGEFVGSEFKLFDNEGNVIETLKANDVATREEAIAENEKIDKANTPEVEEVKSEKPDLSAEALNKLGEKDFLDLLKKIALDNETEYTEEELDNVINRLDDINVQSDEVDYHYGLIEEKNKKLSANKGQTPKVEEVKTETPTVEAPKHKTTASGIPIIEVKDGKKTKEVVDYSQSTPEQGHQHAYRRGAEMGDNIVAEKLKAANDALAKAQKAIEQPKKGKDETWEEYSDRLDAWELKEKDTAAVEKAQKEVDYWNKVAEIETNRKVEEEMRLAEEKEQKIREAKDRFETDDWTSEDLDTVFGDILPRLEGESDDAYQERLEAKAYEDADAINRGERKNVSGSYGKRASAAFDSIYGDAMNGIDGESVVQDLADMYIADGNIKFGFDDLSNQLGKNNMTGEQRNRLFSMLTKNPRHTIESLSEHIAMEYNLMDRQTEIHSALVDAMLKGRKGCVESLEEKATLEQVRPEDMETFATPRMRKWDREHQPKPVQQGEPTAEAKAFDDIMKEQVEPDKFSSKTSLKKSTESETTTADEPVYAEDNKTVKAKTKSGIHDNGKKQTAVEKYGQKWVDVIDKVAKKLGVTIVFEDKVGNNGEYNGSMSGNGVMRVSLQNDVIKTLKWIAGHELTHRMKSLLGEREFTKVVDKMMKDIGMADFAKRYNEYKKNAPKYSQARLIEEVIADYYGDILGDSKVAEKFIKSADKGLLNNMLESISTIKDALVGIDSKKEVEKHLLSSLKEAEKAVSNANKETNDEKYCYKNKIKIGNIDDINSIVGNADEIESKRNKLISTDAIPTSSNVFVDTKESKAYKQAENWFKEHVGSKEYDTDAGKVVIDNRSIRESLAHKYGQKKLDAIRTLAEGFEKATYLGSAEDFTRKDSVDHYFAYPIKYNDNIEYVFCRAILDNNKNRLYVHEVFTEDEIKESSLQTAAARRLNDGRLHGGKPLYKNILSNILYGKVENKNLNNQTKSQENAEKEDFSLKSKQRDEEYVKAVESKDEETTSRLVKDAAKAAMPDTKVVDENGNPLVVYHGSKLAEYYFKDGLPYTRSIPRFNVFNEGKGFFTNDELAARNISAGERGLYASYIDMKKPLVIDAKGNSWSDIPLTDEQKTELGLTETNRITTDHVVYGAKDLGKYDGVIIKNVLEPEGRADKTIDDYIAFKPNQIKSADPITYDNDGKVIPLSERFNEESNDIRYSLKSSAKTYSKAIETGDEKVAREALDEYAKAKGYTIHAYHGTSRADRVGNVFRPERATSGPMVFFTSSKEIGDNYAKSKKDTSMAYDNDWVENDYHSQFKVNVGGYIGETRMEKAWGYLPFSLRSEIIQKAAQARTDWENDSRDIVLDEKNTKGLGAFDWNLKESKGNAIKALLEEWLGSGTLYNDENRFMDVLDKTGVLDAFKQMGWTDAKFQDPNYTEPKTYDTFLKIEKPFDTNESYNDEFINGLENWWNNLSTRKKNSYDKESMEADHWDKNSMSVEEWIEKAREDKDGNTTWAWTTIPDAVTDYIKSLGHDGIIDQGGKGGGSAHSVYIPFKSEQIKSAELKTYDDEGNLIPLDKRFNKREDDIRFSLKVKKSDPFYSNAAKALEDIKQEKATGEQWIAMLKKNGGLKAEEDKWMGLSDWLTGKKGLTKQEVMQYIADNAIKIEEVSYNEFGREYEEYDNPMTVDNWVMFGKKDGYRNNLFFPDGNKFSKTYVAETTHRKTGETVYVPKVNDQYVVGEDNWTPLYFKTPEEAQKAAVDEYNKKYSKGKRVNYVNEINGTRLRYTTEGLENNREIALTIPTIEPYKENDEIHFGDAGNGRAIAWLRFGDATTNRYRIDGEKAYEDYLHKLAEKYGDAALYDPAEYCTDEEVNELNSLFNAFNYKNYSQKGENGDKVLVIDEIQSKRHQDGREMGYKSEYENSARGKFQKATREIREFNKEMDSKYGEFHVLDNLTPEEQKRYQELYDAQTEASQYDTEQEKSYNVPDAPFQKTWHELAMKRALRYAAENGYDKIAWTTGEQQADRYDLSKTVGYISVYPAVDPITGERVEGKYDLFVRDRYHNTYPEASGLKTVKEIQEIIGKEVGSKLTSEADANGEQGAHVKGNDLKIGGDGMKGFYDKMLPSFMDKYGKKWGVKTQDIELDLPNKSDRIMHSIDVTEEMRKSVMEGQPKFSLKKGKDESYAEFAKRVEEIYNNGKKREYDETNQGFFDFDDPNNDGDGTYQTPAGRTKKPNDTQLFLDFDNAPEEVKEVVKVSPIARGDKDVSNDDLTNTFGFVIKPGFTQKQRNDIYDSFVFMSETLGVSPKALSLGGALSLSMNNRLRSTIAQYRYFPSGKARGLEFGRGVVGDIAHEWTHALDNYLLGNQRTKAGDDSPYGSHMSDMTEEYLEGKGVRKEVVEAMKDIFKAMKDSGYNDQVAEYSKTIGNASYWKSTTEKLARCMETYMMQKEGSTKTLADVYRDYSKESVEGLYPSEEQMKTIAPAYDKFFATLEERTGDNGYPELYSLKNANAAKKRVDDMKKDIANMNLRIGAMGSSDKELKTLVADLTHYVNKNIDAQLATRLGSARIKAILSDIGKATSKKDLEQPVRDIQTMLGEAETEILFNKRSNLLNLDLQGKNQRGVAIAKHVDDDTRKALRNMGDNLNEDRVNYMTDFVKDGQDYADMLANGVEVPKELEQKMQISYPLRQLNLDVNEAKQALDQAKKDWEDAVNAIYQIKRAPGYMAQRNQARTLAQAAQDVCLEKQKEYNLAINDFNEALGYVYGFGSNKLSAWKKAKADHKKELLKGVYGDVKRAHVLAEYENGGDDATRSTAQKAKDAWDSFNEKLGLPLHSLNYMLQMLDQNHANKMGYMYRTLFADPKRGIVHAADMMAEGKAAFGDAIEAKVNELFGIKKSKAFNTSAYAQLRQKSETEFIYDVTRRLNKDEAFQLGDVTREGEDITREKMSKGHALYLWLTWRQPDGKMKMIKQGYDQASVDDIEAKLGNEYIEFGKWVSDEFLPNLRKTKYNPRHIEMYGTSMAENPHYFPLKIDKGMVETFGEFGKPNDIVMPSTVAPNLIHRSNNVLPVDRNANAFDILKQYGEAMEQWHAMSPLIEDFNTIHASRIIKKAMDANRKGNFKMLMEAAQVATGSIYDNPNATDRVVNDVLNKAISRGARAAIVFRFMTAIKQLLSYPAFMTYSGSLRFQGELAANFYNPKRFLYDNHKWAMENLPAYRQRSKDSDMGLEGMGDEFMVNKWDRALTKWGMIANRTVDKMTVAAGARAVYNEAIRQGKSHEEAVIEAEICYNESQQSSRNEFSSMAQKSGSSFLRPLMLFQNANISYAKQVRLAMWDIVKAMRDKDITAFDKTKIVGKSAFAMGMFGAILQGLWQAGGNTNNIVGLVQNMFDDKEWFGYLTEEEKRAYIISAITGLTTSGTIIGSPVNAVIGGFSISQNKLFDTVNNIAEAYKTSNAFDKKFFDKALPMILEPTLGISLRTGGNIYECAKDLAVGNPENGADIFMDMALLLNMNKTDREGWVKRLYKEYGASKFADAYLKASEWQKTNNKNREVARKYVEAKDAAFLKEMERLAKLDKKINSKDVPDEEKQQIWDSEPMLRNGLYEAYDDVISEIAKNIKAGGYVNYSDEDIEKSLESLVKFYNDKKKETK